MTANIIRKRLSVLLVLLILSVGFTAAYGTAAASKKRPADVSIDGRRELVGTWDCSGVLVGPDGAGRPYYGLMQNEWTLDQTWLAIHFVEQKPVTPKPIIEDQYWGYTDATGKHTRTIMANDGAFGMLSSDGWQQATMPWQGSYTSGGATFAYTETVERHTVDRYRWYGSIMENGASLMSYDVMCKRK